MIRNKRYFDLTEEEIARAAKLTPKEQAAVDALVAAVKALPRSITLEIEDYDDRDDGLAINKRITAGSTLRVALVRKKSIVF